MGRPRSHEVGSTHHQWTRGGSATVLSALRRQTREPAEITPPPREASERLHRFAHGIDECEFGTAFRTFCENPCQNRTRSHSIASARVDAV